SATRRIAAGDLEAVVPVDSDDEFGDLAASFNGMAGALERQISLLRSLDAIDESVLVPRDRDASIADAVSRLAAALRASHVANARITDQEEMVIHCLNVREASRTTRQGVLSSVEREELLRSSREILLRGGQDARSYAPSPHTGRSAAAKRQAAGEQLLVLPLLQEHALVGVVTLTYEQQVASWSAERERARRLADRLALALSNVHLVQRLESLSTATLTAFARAIDANSPWTAGHSERVTRLALVVGKRMNLAASDLETLHRGGLLHDIGKIGVAPAILDKPGKLTDEEWRAMQLHPTLGAQILAPLSVFADAIPIVLHHHERWDGTGYPARLAGAAIPRLARVLAVADTFDALVSRRPYREGLPIQNTMAYIESGSGSHFDPQVVEAMLAAYGAGEIVVASATSAEAELAQALEQGRHKLGRVA
ncbi:MAG TPA: HD domain-containing phosphohydrolase, partial [Gemmatimonadaceae bacterium]|nr:HD domain-containing phosphohydrolase [Gemmatimonadaceae bacterium]